MGSFFVELLLCFKSIFGSADLFIDLFDSSFFDDLLTDNIFFPFLFELPK